MDLKTNTKKKLKRNISFGPFPADGFGGAHEIDAVIATHDQGLVPFKTLSFGEE
jgi:4-hydroxy-L-threonine phosphate dehydrogenase PdxA